MEDSWSATTDDDEELVVDVPDVQTWLFNLTASREERIQIQDQQDEAIRVAAPVVNMQLQAFVDDIHDREQPSRKPPKLGEQ